MNCYLCHSKDFITRKGAVRDMPSLKVIECCNCGLVTLSNLNHIQDGFYENSGMHGEVLPSMKEWLQSTNWDDQRRFDMLKASLPNKKILDFGCGAGGFIDKAKSLAGKVAGVEPERRVREYWLDQFPIYGSLDEADDKYDLITAFHVVEHLPDPKAILEKMAARLGKNGRLVIEVPNAGDALLTLYDSEPFQSFTYWSQHLYLFNATNLHSLAKQAKLRVISIQQWQRYPLSNHLYWLSQGRPGGHDKWGFLDSSKLQQAYTAALAAVGKCDTLVAYLELEDANT
jgi:2-polyprenyl-3-methyl-5-hydroxy-6-metoxy-1,4-benzoquinol methylase